MSFQENLNKILVKHQELSNKLASGIKGEEFVKCSKEYSDLEEVVHQINDYNKAIKELGDAAEFLKDKTLDSETKEIYTMEVNPRFGGAMLTTWGAGVPWFEIVLCDYLKLEIPTFSFRPNTLMVRSFREHFFEGYTHD